VKVIKGTVENGQITLSEPLTWPDGTEVRIRAIPAASEANGADEEDAGISEDEQADDPESIARWIAAFDAIPPLHMTPEEEAEWQAARKAQKEFEKAAFDERADKLRRIWE
jgi:hypothetical protein